MNVTLAINRPTSKEEGAIIVIGRNDRPSPAGVLGDVILNKDGLEAVRVTMTPDRALYIGATLMQFARDCGAR